MLLKQICVSQLHQYPVHGWTDSLLPWFWDMLHAS